MDRLNTELKENAVSLGLCQDWQRNKWGRNLTEEELIGLYKTGIDFCIKHSYPTNDFFKSRGERDTLNRCGVFVDERVDVKDGDNGIYVINGACTGEMSFSTNKVATVYMRHESKVKIKASGFAKVFVRLYDNAEAERECTELGKIIIRDKRK